MVGHRVAVGVLFRGRHQLAENERDLLALGNGQRVALEDPLAAGQQLGYHGGGPVGLRYAPRAVELVDGRRARGGAGPGPHHDKVAVPVRGYRRVALLSGGLLVDPGLGADAVDRAVVALIEDAAAGQVLLARLVPSAAPGHHEVPLGVHGHRRVRLLIERRGVDLHLLRHLHGRLEFHRPPQQQRLRLPGEGPPAVRRIVDRQNPRAAARLAFIGGQRFLGPEAAPEGRRSRADVDQRLIVEDRVGEIGAGEVVPARAPGPTIDEHHLGSALGERDGQVADARVLDVQLDVQVVDDETAGNVDGVRERGRRTGSRRIGDRGQRDPRGGDVRRERQVDHGLPIDVPLNLPREHGRVARVGAVPGTRPRHHVAGAGGVHGHIGENLVSRRAIVDQHLALQIRRRLGRGLHRGRLWRAVGPVAAGDDVRSFGVLIAGPGDDESAGSVHGHAGEHLVSAGRHVHLELGALGLAEPIVTPGVHTVSRAQLIRTVLLAVAGPGDDEIAVGVHGHVGPLLIVLRVAGVDQEASRGVGGEDGPKDVGPGQAAQRVELARVHVGVAAVGVVGPRDDEVAVGVHRHAGVPLQFAFELIEPRGVFERGDRQGREGVFHHLQHAAAVDRHARRGYARQVGWGAVGVEQTHVDAIVLLVRVVGGPDHHVVAVGVARYGVGRFGMGVAVLHRHTTSATAPVNRVVVLLQLDGEVEGEVLADRQVPAAPERLLVHVAEARGAEEIVRGECHDRIGAVPQGRNLVRKPQVAVEHEHGFPLVRGGPRGGVGPSEAVVLSGQFRGLVQPEFDLGHATGNLHVVLVERVVERIERAVGILQRVAQHQLFVEGEHHVPDRLLEGVFALQCDAVGAESVGHARAGRVGGLVERPVVDVVVGDAAVGVFLRLGPHHHEVAVGLHADRHLALVGTPIVVLDVDQPRARLGSGRQVVAAAGGHAEGNVTVVDFPLEHDLVDRLTRTDRVLPRRVLPGGDFRVDAAEPVGDQPDLDDRLVVVGVWLPPVNAGSRCVLQLGLDDGSRIPGVEHVGVEVRRDRNVLVTSRVAVIEPQREVAALGGGGEGEDVAFVHAVALVVGDRVAEEAVAVAELDVGVEAGVHHAPRLAAEQIDDLLHQRADPAQLLVRGALVRGTDQEVLDVGVDLVGRALRHEADAGAEPGTADGKRLDRRVEVGQQVRVLRVVEQLDQPFLGGLVEVRALGHVGADPFVGDDQVAVFVEGRLRVSLPSRPERVGGRSEVGAVGPEHAPRLVERPTGRRARRDQRVLHRANALRRPARVVGVAKLVPGDHEVVGPVPGNGGGAGPSDGELVDQHVALRVEDREVQKEEEGTLVEEVLVVGVVPRDHHVAVVAGGHVRIEIDFGGLGVDLELVADRYAEPVELARMDVVEIAEVLAREGFPQPLRTCTPCDGEVAAGVQPDGRLALRAGRARVDAEGRAGRHHALDPRVGGAVEIGVDQEGLLPRFDHRDRGELPGEDVAHRAVDHRVGDLALPRDDEVAVGVDGHVGAFLVIAVQPGSEMAGGLGRVDAELGARLLDGDYRVGAQIADDR